MEVNYMYNKDMYMHKTRKIGIRKNRSKYNNSCRLNGRLRDFYDADFRLWDLVNQHKSGYVWVNEPNCFSG